MIHRFTTAVVLMVTLATVIRAEDAAISYDVEIKPIFRSHCLGCHNSQQKKGDLALDTFEATMVGGASGEVIYAADLESSRLWALVNHDEQPSMPPNSDKIADAKLDLIRRWIEEGAAERSGMARARPKKNALQFQPTMGSDNTSGPMPVGVCRQPVVATERAAAVTALAASPQAPLLAVGGQQQVALYHTQTAALLGIIPFPEGTPQVVRFSRDGGLLLIAGGRGAHSGFVALHEVATGRRLTRVADEIDTILAADVDASLSYVALGGPTKLVKILSTGTGETLFEIKKHTDWITALEFSPDGRLLATADRAGGLIVWEADTAREYQVLDGHQETITSLSWRADSKVFATGSEDDTIRLWDPEKRQAIRNWGAHGGGVASVQFAGDGGIVSAGRDQRAKQWDGAAKQLRAFAPMNDIVLSVCISSDAKRVFSGDWTGELRGYDADADQHTTALAVNPATLQQQLSALEQQVQPLGKQLADVRLTYEAAVAKKNAAQLNWQQSLEALTTIQQQISVAASSFEEIRTVLSSAAAENEAEIQQKLDQLAGQLAKLGGEGQQLADKTRSASAALTQTRQEELQQAELVQQADARLTARNQEIEQLRQEIQSFDGQLPNLELLVADTEDNLLEMRNELEQARQQLAAVQALRQKIESLEASISATEDKASRSRAELEWLQQAYGPRQ